MNNDYLWDRTGEPDAEVQELEDVLGTLRYEPRPFALPADLQAAPRRRFFPTLAIAATIALMVLAAGVWIRFHRPQPARSGEIVRAGKEQKSVKERSLKDPSTSNGHDELTAVPRDKEPRVAPGPQRNPAPRRNTVARNANRTNTLMQRDEMTAMQRAEAEAAKDQLLLALRVTSAKLNLAQRKTQLAPATNNIRNQHKLG